MVDETVTKFRPLVQSNGFGGNSAHVFGFSVETDDDPVLHGKSSLFVDHRTAERKTKKLNNISIERLYALDSGSQWQVEHNLKEMGSNYSTMGLWSVFGSYFQGFNAGFPAYWGAYTYGSATIKSELKDMASRHLTGISGGIDYYPQFGVNSYYGSAVVDYDRSTQTVNVTIQLNQENTLTRTYENGFPGLKEIEKEEAPNSLKSAINCQAAVVDGMFRCGKESSGIISGRFYGPNGNEVSGTFALNILHYSGHTSPFDLNWFIGFIGAFSVNADKQPGHF